MLKEDLKIIDKYQKEILVLGGVSSLLDWDQQTYMPKNSLNTRSEQSSLIQSIIHNKMTSDKFFQAVENLKKEKLDKRNSRLIEKLHKEISKAKKLPKEFVEELSKTASLAFNAWIDAKEKNNFTIFQPYLEKIVVLKRKQVDYLNSFLNMKGHKYNVLLDDFEEGMTVEKLSPLFEQLKNDLIKISKKIKIISKKNKLINELSKDLQIKLANDMAVKIGLIKDYSRIDFSEHPFTTKIGINDVRITYNLRDDQIFSFTSTMHEAGHALYELQLPKEEQYSFLGNAPSYGLHESQSRFWELMIGLGKPLWRYIHKKYHLSSNYLNWYSTINQIKNSPIRIESSEIFYCLHIILRFEIEKGLIDGSIKIKDLPKIWNAKMKEYLNITPKSDKEGVLQDVHWTQGYFGYFPSYALGTIYSAQLYQALKKQIPNFEKEIEIGDFTIIKAWLRENIHKYGSTKIAEEIIKNATGDGLNPQVFIEYLNNKYKDIYSF